MGHTSGQGESGLSEGSTASHPFSAELRRTAVSSSAVGGAAQARQVLRSWIVGSSWAAP
jgi:hypothetical protein